MGRFDLSFVNPCTFRPARAPGCIEEGRVRVAVVDLQVALGIDDADAVHHVRHGLALPPGALRNLNDEISLL